MRVVGPLALVLFAVAAAGAQARFGRRGGAAQQSRRGADGPAIYRARAESFAAALKKDPKLAQAAVNEGIALLTLQRLDEAKKALEQGIALNPDSAQAWYNLGLAEHAGNELEPALASFQNAVKLDPRDADSIYFEGVCYQEMKQFDKAIAILDAGHCK